MYTDGSGLANGVPEATRCGWAVVELSPGLWPVRALFGPLPGGCQTVPRAERHAILEALRVGPRGVEVISDHLSAVLEGQRWTADLAESSSRHASIWREMFA